MTLVLYWGASMLTFWKIKAYINGNMKVTHVIRSMVASPND